MVLGRDVRVGRGASVKRSVIWDGALIDEAAELRGTVVGWRGRVKAAASCFEGSVVGDRSVVGERCVIKPGVKIWPEKWVEKGTRLSASLVWGKSARPHFFGSRGIAGDLITEINPEIAARLGAAVGSVKGGRLSICTDGRPASQMIRQALLSGLLATGVKVVDFGNLTLPAHRYGIRALRLGGGSTSATGAWKRSAYVSSTSRGLIFRAASSARWRGCSTGRSTGTFPAGRLQPLNIIPISTGPT